MALVVLLLASEGRAGEALDLETLLQPPATSVAPQPARWTGEERSSWHRAYEVARLEVRRIEGRLDRVRERRTSWRATRGEPRAGAEVVRLKAQLQRQRQSLEIVYQTILELEVDAMIAGLPLEQLR